MNYGPLTTHTPLRWECTEVPGHLVLVVRPAPEENNVFMLSSVGLA